MSDTTDSISSIDSIDQKITEAEIDQLIQLFKKDIHRNYGLFVSLNQRKKQKHRSQNVSNRKCKIENQTNTNTNLTINNYEQNKSIILPKYANDFFGRHIELDQLDQMLENGKLVYILGKNGYGKTEFAKFFINNYHYKYWSVEWLNGKNKEKFLLSISYIANKYNIDDDVKGFSTFFKDKNSLIIIDNYNDIQFHQYFLRSSKVTILLTTTNNTNNNIYLLPSLNIVESLDILQSVLQENFIKSSEKNWENICHFFDNIPLALQLVASYINEHMSTDKKINVEKYFNDYTNVDSTDKIYIALSSTLKVLQIHTNVLDVLNTCIYLDDDFISVQVLLLHENILNSREKLENVLEILKKFKLIHIEIKENMKFIHIHETIRQILYLEQKKNKNTNKYFLSSLTILIHIGIFNIHHILHVLQYAKDFIHDFTVFVLTNNRKLILETIIKYNFYDILDSILEHISNKKQLIDADNLIFIAVEYNQIQILKVLFKHNADVNIILNNISVLHLASKKLFVPIVAILLAHKANPNFEDNKKNTPLHYAVDNATKNEENAIQISKMLLKHGANIHAKNLDGYTVLFKALENKCYKLALFLLQYIHNVNKHNPKISSPIVVLLSWQIFQKDELQIFKIVKELLKKNADINTVDYTGQNLLLWAVENRSSIIAEYLLAEKKMDPNFQDVNGQTALHKILNQSIPNKNEAKNTVRIVRLLLDHKANTSIEDNDGYTPYEYGQSHGNIKLCLYIQFLNFELPEEKKKIFYLAQEKISPIIRKPPPKPYFWKTETFHKTMNTAGNVAKDFVHCIISNPPLPQPMCGISGGPPVLQIAGPR